MIDETTQASQAQVMPPGSQQVGAQVPATPPTTQVVDIKSTPSEDDLAMAALRANGGADDSQSVSFPSFRLEHTTTPDGEPNPLAGHFTITKRNSLGSFESEDLGDKVEFEVLKQRYFLSMSVNNNKTKYTSREFDKETKDNGSKIALWKREGQNNGTLVDSKTVQEWYAEFPNLNPESKRTTAMWLMYALYIRVNGEIVKWKTNVSSMVAWSQYSRNVSTFGVVTEATVEEQKNGATKYYVPVLTALHEIANPKKNLADQEVLNSVLGGPTVDTATAATEILGAGDAAPDLD